MKDMIYGNALFHTKMEDGVWRAQTIKPFVLWNKMEAEINLCVEDADVFKDQYNAVMIVHLTHDKGGLVTTWDSSNDKHCETLDSLFCDWQDFLDMWCAAIAFRKKPCSKGMTHDVISDDNWLGLKRLVAAVDVPEVGVKKGDKGGLIGHRSLIEIDSWVFPGSYARDCTLPRRATLLSNSIILNESSVASCHVSDSVISDSLLSVCPIVHDSKVEKSNIFRASIEQSTVRDCCICESSYITSSLLESIHAVDDSRFGASTVSNVICVKTDFINSEIVGGFFNECSVKHNNYAAIPNIGDVHVDAMIALDKDGHFVYHVGGEESWVWNWSYHTGGINDQESKQLFLEKCYEKAQLMGTEMDREEFWEIAEMLTDAAKKQIGCASKTDQEW